MPLLKTKASWADLVHAPTVEHMLGPVCMTCGRVVDSEELVEGYPGQTTYAKMLVKHHGAEELGEFDMGSKDWDERDLGPMMRRRNWFDPTRYEGLGLGTEIRDAREYDDTDEVKVFSDGGASVK
jgi:hypothetical protein